MKLFGRVVVVVGVVVASALKVSSFAGEAPPTSPARSVEQFVREVVKERERRFGLFVEGTFDASTYRQPFEEKAPIVLKEASAEQIAAAFSHAGPHLTVGGRDGLVVITDVGTRVDRNPLDFLIDPIAVSGSFGQVFQTLLRTAGVSGGADEFVDAGDVELVTNERRSLREVFLDLARRYRLDLTVDIYPRAADTSAGNEGDRTREVASRFGVVRLTVRGKYQFRSPAPAETK